MIFAAIQCKLKRVRLGVDLLDARLYFLAAIVAVMPVSGAYACDGLDDGPSGVVTAVLDGNTVKLDSGIIVRLIGSDAPHPKGLRTGSVAEPLADAAKAALTKLVLNQNVRLSLDSEETDRYGHMEAQLFIDAPDGAWVEQALIADGVARAVVPLKDRRCIGELIAAEAAPRSNGLGIWADPYYSVRDAADPAALAGRTGHYELIEGEVVSTGEARGRLYLDFGRVWKDDVTATIDQKARGLFTAAGIDPLSLKGERVRIRGWVEDRQGPLIELDVPEQIEVLSSK